MHGSGLKFRRREKNLRNWDMNHLSITWTGNDRTNQQLGLIGQDPWVLFLCYGCRCLSSNRDDCLLNHSRGLKIHRHPQVERDKLVFLFF